ncbi:R53.5-related protein [Scenedesmus sp. NREL 46B-D3]|nr:R53.5-related protein [Scenedesmus sp. NREL 46B-D3]
MYLPPLSLISEATLTNKLGEQIKAKELWSQQHCFIYCIRRPGCVLCRDEAQKLWKEQQALTDAGLKVVCVVHEWIEREISAFVPEYWAGEIYHDADKAFYKAFGQGQLRTGSSLALLNPLNPAWGRIVAARKNVKDSNVVGEASILGGLLVVKAGEGGIAWMHAEKTFGEFPDTQDVIAAAKAAVSTAH